MEIILSNSSPKPIYEQITSQMKAMIMNGVLKPGDALPSMRALAKSLHVSVITAQHAYEELSRDGFIETVAGKGTFVSNHNKEFLKEEQLRMVQEKIEDLVELAKMSGLDLAQLLDAVQLIYEEE